MFSSLAPLGMEKRGGNRRNNSIQYSQESQAVQDVLSIFP
jgi:hypothetical protein